MGYGTIFITKYALSGGVKLADLHRPIDPNGYASTTEKWGGFYSKGDYRLTWPEALADCEAKRAAKIASLKKQIVKLEKMKFEEPLPTRPDAGGGE